MWDIEDIKERCLEDHNPQDNGGEGIESSILNPNVAQGVLCNDKN